MGGTLKIVFRSGYELTIQCECYNITRYSNGKINSIKIDPVDKHQPSILDIDTSEIALVTIER